MLGYAMVKIGLPLIPFILGVLLGNQIKIDLIRPIMSDPDAWLFVTRPIQERCSQPRSDRSCRRCAASWCEETSTRERRTRGRSGYLDGGNGQSDDGTASKTETR